VTRDEGQVTRETGLSIEDVIAEITGITHRVETVAFAGRIGNVLYVGGQETVDWVFEKGGERSVKVAMPRGTFEYLREPPMVAFWLVEMTRATAERFGVERFALDPDEAERHRTRILAAAERLGLRDAEYKSRPYVPVIEPVPVRKKKRLAAAVS
jgi:hypothetical protein